MGDGGIKAYQIYYDESQKDSLMGGFVPYFNEKATVNLESGVTRDLVNQGECSNCDWFGVFSWKVRDKVKGFDFGRLNDVTAKSEEYDVLSVNPKNRRTRLRRVRKPHLIRTIQEEIWPPMDMLLKKLQQAGIIPAKKEGYMVKKQNYIYCNFFLAKQSIYLDYVNLLLKPSLEIIETDEKLYNQVMEPAIQYCDPPPKFREDTKCKHFPKLPFILERLINVYVEANNLKVGWKI